MTAGSAATDSSLSCPAKAGHPVNSSACYCRIKIIPIRINAFYQSDFPSAVPLFESLLAPNCILDIIVLLKIDKALDSMSFCEPVNSVRLVLEHTPYEIVCNADIERSANSACKDVDVIAHPSAITDSSGYWIARLRGR